MVRTKSLANSGTRGEKKNLGSGKLLRGGNKMRMERRQGS
jgi:hypothetical protein